MRPIFDPGDQVALENARQMFGPSYLLEQLVSGDAPGGRGDARTSFAALYEYFQQLQTNAEMEAALQADVTLRAGYRRLVEKFSAPFVPLAIAADSGEENAREGVGCRLHFVPSSAEPSQTYVIVEFTEQLDASESILFLCDQDDNCLKVPLDAAHDGKVQLLLENSSDLLARLRDKNTVIFRRS